MGKLRNQKLVLEKYRHIIRGMNSHIKGEGCSLSRFGVWSHLGCPGQNPIICSREGLL